MIKNQFKSQAEFDVYLAEQIVRMKGGYLTRSERETLKDMMNKNYKPILIKEEPKKGKEIITNINLLRIPCTRVTKEDKIDEIIKDLKETLSVRGGLGLSANQISYNKAICYVKTPKKINKDRSIEYSELILINPIITEKDRPIKVKDESCLSLPGIFITTKRYVFITVEYLDEKLEPKVAILQDLEAITCQHEVDHLNGKTILENKWRAK